MAASKYPADVGRAALTAVLARLGGPRQWRERAGPPGLLAGGLLVALLAGGMVALAFAQLQGGLGLTDVAPRRLPVGAAAVGTARAAGAVASTPLAPSIPPVTPTLPATPTPPPPREAPVAAGLAVGVQSTAAPSPPTSVPAPTPTPAVPATPTSAVPPPTPTSAARPTPEPTATPTVADSWQALLPELDVAWGGDLPRAILLLDAFVARYPEHEPARDKLYAALVEHARALIEQGAASEAVAELTRADELLPERVEAPSVLAALTPTATAPLQAQPPAPDPAPRAAVPQTAPRPAPQSAPQTAPPRSPPPPLVASRPPAPPPAPQPFVAPRRAVAPAPPPPTPTKMPFVPPAGR